MTAALGPTALALAFPAAWNEADAEAREAALGALLAPGLRYADPHLPALVEGSAAYLAHLRRFRERFPGLRAEPTAAFQYHQGFVLIPWRMLRPDGALHQAGQWVTERDEHGRIRLLVVFEA
jgi:hypothetical protein